MQGIEIRLKGASPLLMHNVQLADPDHPATREIKVITGKKKKTEQDRRELGKLEWFAGLYLGKDGPVIPTHMIRKCIINAARISKLGKNVERALLFMDYEVPLVYDGPRDATQLFNTEGFAHRAVVGMQGGKKTMRVRPKFTKWEAVARAKLLTDVMDIDDLCRVVELAGTTEGLGDGRNIGFGRFDGTVKTL